jgi:hypothetical protein
LEQAFEDRKLIPPGFIDDAQQEWVPANGAKVVALAWTAAAFKQRLPADGKAAVAELGFTMPAHHKPTCDVLFRTEDLWPQGADPALVHAGVFESYPARASQRGA